MTLVIVLLVFLFVIILDYLPVIKGKDWRVSLIYGIFLAAGFIIMLFESFDIRLPNPLAAVRPLYEKAAAFIKLP